MNVSNSLVKNSSLNRDFTQNNEKKIIYNEDFYPYKIHRV